VETSDEAGGRLLGTGRDLGHRWRLVARPAPQGSCVELELLDDGPSSTVLRFDNVPGSDLLAAGMVTVPGGGAFTVGVLDPRAVNRVEVLLERAGPVEARVVADGRVSYFLAASPAGLPVRAVRGLGAGDTDVRTMTLGTGGAP
jgi:hypothetical protein